MLCQLAFLGVDTYTIVAFDAETYSFCQLHDLQCVPASMDIWWSSVNGWLVSSSSSHQFEYGTQGFRDVSKLKCQQVLRALRAGYDVIWSDVDIHWEKDPLPGLLEDVRRTKADIAIQSDAPVGQHPTSNINSGFYYVVRSNQTIAAFEEMVHHASLHPELSEQRSFDKVLCGGKNKVAERLCLDENNTTSTYVLDPDVYINGDYENKFQDLGEVNIIHFNWRVGLTKKTEGFKKRGKWRLDENTGSCTL